MFDSPLPTISITEFKSAVADATQTASKVANLAARKGSAASRELTTRFEVQINELRTQAVHLFDKADQTATELEERFEPVLAMATKRLPAPVASVATMVSKQGAQLRHKAHLALVDVLAPATTTAEPVTTAEASSTTTEPTPKVNVASGAPTTRTAKKKPTPRVAASAKASQTPKNTSKSIKTK